MPVRPQDPASGPRFNTVAITMMVGLGGGLGACCRWAVELLVTSIFDGPNWVATMTVNLLGAFIIGGMFAWIDSRFPRLVDIELQAAELPLAHHWIGPVVVTGGLGAFTTYSSFSLDTVELIEAGHIGTAIGFVALSLVTGILAIAAGIRVGIRLVHNRV